MVYCVSYHWAEFITCFSLMLVLHTQRQTRTHTHAHIHQGTQVHSLYRILPSWFEHNIIRNGDYNVSEMLFWMVRMLLSLYWWCALSRLFGCELRMQLYIFRHSLIILHKHGVVFARCPSLLNDISMHERFVYGQRVAIEDTENGREIIQPKTKYTLIRSGTETERQRQRQGRRGEEAWISFRNAFIDGVSSTFIGLTIRIIYIYTSYWWK